MTGHADRRARTLEKQRAAFCDALREGKTVSQAAASIGVGRATVYDWRKADDDFAAAWDDAYETGTDLIEQEAIRRAVEGVDEPVFYKGEVCGHVRKFSDTLLMQQLNARRPEKYRQNHKVEHTGGVKITISPDDAAL